MRVASGVLGLSFRELGQMTPFEVDARVQEELKRQERDRRFAAQLTVAQLNVAERGLRNPITVDEFLGTKAEPQRMKKSLAKFIKQVTTKGRTYADYEREHGK